MSDVFREIIVGVFEFRDRSSGASVVIAISLGERPGTETFRAVFSDIGDEIFEIDNLSNFSSLSLIVSCFCFSSVILIKSYYKKLFLKQYYKKKSYVIFSSAFSAKSEHVVGIELVDVWRLE